MALRFDIWHNQGCKRDLSSRDRDKTETFGFGPRRDRDQDLPLIPRDRDETETSDFCHETRPRPRPCKAETETFFETFNLQHCAKTMNSEPASLDVTNSPVTQLQLVFTIMKFHHISIKT